MKNEAYNEWNRMESNGIEWNRMESNGMEWNGMESNGIEWTLRLYNIIIMYIPNNSHRKYFRCR